MVRDLITKKQSAFTRSERKLIATLLDASLVTGLQSITKLANQAQVSTPTVIRLARKLGFDGYPELQDAIREEVSARIQQPLAKLKDSQKTNNEDHIINRYATTASHNINQTLDHLDVAMFDNVASLLSDSSRHLYLIGGRVTRPNADYFFNHLQIIRANVSLLNSSPSVWPQSLLEVNAQSTLIVFDIRRYEKLLYQLAQIVVHQGANIVLFTDQWVSPIEKYASYTLHGMVEAPSSWDSTLTINFLIEALVAEIQNNNQKASAKRIAALETMNVETRIFGGP